MGKAKEQKFVLEFIELYRRYPTLWKSKSKEYRDRDKKIDAYNILVNKYREVDQQADRETVKKKINSLRTNYRKELKKLEESYNSGSNIIYKPTLWYFHHLNFLQDQESSAGSSSDTNGDFCTIKIEDHDYECVTLDVENHIEEEIKNPMKLLPSVKRHLPSPLAKKYKRHESDSGNDRVPEVPYCNLGRPEEEYEVIARAWAYDLIKMRPDQQLLAKKIINDVLFEGQMGTLNRDSGRLKFS